MKENKEKISIIEADIYIFDMDGTLYSNSDGSNSFRESKLFGTVIEGTKKYIQKMEKCSSIKAEEILNIGLLDGVGVSNFLAQRYHISRKEYFNQVWIGDPEEIVFNFKTSKELLNKLKMKNKTLVLLTSAPSVWGLKVIDYLGVSDIFSEKYFGENYGNKQEIFEKIRNENNGKRIISIGNQYKSDIKPAQELGLMTLLVRNSEDLNRLVN